MAKNTAKTSSSTWLCIRCTDSNFRFESSNCNMERLARSTNMISAKALARALADEQLIECSVEILRCSDTQPSEIVFTAPSGPRRWWLSQIKASNKRNKNARQEVR